MLPVAGFETPPPGITGIRISESFEDPVGKLLVGSLCKDLEKVFSALDSGIIQLGVKASVGPEDPHFSVQYGEGERTVSVGCFEVLKTGVSEDLRLGPFVIGFFGIRRLELFDLFDFFFV